MLWRANTALRGGAPSRPTDTVGARPTSTMLAHGRLPRTAKAGLAERLPTPPALQGL